MTISPAITAPYLRQFAERAPALAGAGNAALRALRDQAIEDFARDGFPTSKVEAWKFTNLNALTKNEFTPARAAADGVDRQLLSALTVAGGGPLLVFVNGGLRRELSAFGELPTGVTVTSLADWLATDPDAAGSLLARVERRRDRSLMALNTALAGDGAVIRIGGGVAVEQPIQLLFLTPATATAEASYPRNLIILEQAASATVIETHAGQGRGVYWTNAVTQAIVGREASLRHYKLQDESVESFHIAATEVALADRASYASFALSLGAQLARNEIDVTLGGEGASCRLDGANLARGRQHLDTTTRIDHAKPRGTSSETYRNVVDDRGHAVFQGRIRVAVDAQKSDARQLNQNLLLSDAAQVDSKPELEILADDVKCSHGATVGDLDQQAMFYLRARGIDEPTARALLIEAFVGELIDGIEEAAPREHFRRAFGAWLAKTGNEQ